MSVLARRSPARLRPTLPIALLGLLGLMLWLPGGAFATYEVPPETLADIVDAPPTPGVMSSPDRSHLLLIERPSLPPIAELSEEELRLGGLRFKPQTNGPSRARPSVGLSLVRVADGATRAITGLPERPRIGSVMFSPDGGHVAFTHTTRDGIALWVASVETGEARALTEPVLNMAAGIWPSWSADGRSLVALLIPEGRGPAPPAPRVPAGPVVRENLGETGAARTYQDLLKNAHDEALFSHYLTGQAARIGLDGSRVLLGEPAIFWTLEPSPDGRYLLVEVLHAPFSYLVPASRFPRRIEVWNDRGEPVRQVADLPLQEGVPTAFGSVPVGVRNVAWRNDVDAMLVWSEALDGGDAGADAEARDRLFLLDAPFAGAPTPWLTLTLRFGGVYWGDDNLALVASWWWKTRRQRTLLARPGTPTAKTEVLFDRSWEDRYNDPGSPITVPDARGRSVLLRGGSGRTLYMIGEGASPEGNRPFLDTFDLDTKKTERLFRSRAPYYERPVSMLDAASGVMLSRRESVTEPPSYQVRTLGSDAEPRPLVQFPHPTPQLAGLQKELITYEREDGVSLSATLYLPPGYDAERDGPLPMVMWAYPQEFKSADAAGQITDSPYRFDRVGWWSSLLWLTQGYAVLDDPAMPIVGEGEAEPNDTFRAQLVSSARAAVEEVVGRGVADRDRIAIGGHSYGAFMTANLLAHSDLFKAGIARSGAYNRTLTPFGFQSEERSYWEAPEVYNAMSPFMHADKVNEPILLIHGEADNNSGTFPIQSERYYAALKGHGATARLVMLPHESHGYRARESILHMLWETHRWLETYVKGADEKPPVVTPMVEDRGGR